MSKWLHLQVDYVVYITLGYIRPGCSINKVVRITSVGLKSHPAAFIIMLPTPAIIVATISFFALAAIAFLVTAVLAVAATFILFFFVATRMVFSADYVGLRPHRPQLARH